MKPNVSQDLVKDLTVTMDETIANVDVTSSSRPEKIRPDIE
jgi:hypothetical protein